MIYPQDYVGFFFNDPLAENTASAMTTSASGDPTKGTTTTTAPAPGVPPTTEHTRDLSGLDLSWLTGPIQSTATTAVSYAGLALLGVLLIVVSLYVILTDRGPAQVSA